jgi:putative transposase
MARKRRINAADLCYHVTARGVGRMPIYRDDHDRHTFMERLAAVVDEFRLECYAYCLMSNHYHLVVRTLEPNLSDAAKKLNGPYAQWWNWHNERVGHAFGGRFKGQIVQDTRYLLNACRYVVLNPVRAQMVTSPADWRWSSYRATAGLAPVPPFLAPDTVWRLVGGDDPEAAMANYRQFVAESDPEPLPSGPVVGDDEFVERFGALRKGTPREDQPRCRLAPQDLPPLDKIFAGATTRAAVHGRVLYARVRGHSMGAIARYLGVDPSTVSKLIKRRTAQSGRREGSDVNSSRDLGSDPT